MQNHIIVIAVILAAAIGIAYLVIVDRKNRRIREEKDQQERNAQHAESMRRALEKDERGERLFQAVKKAANDNREGKVFEVSVGRLKQNAGSYSVIVQKRDPDGTAVGCGMQFDIQDDKLHYFLNFHEAGDMELTEFDKFVELATSRTAAVA